MTEQALAPAWVAVGLGANLGDRAATLAWAVQAIAGLPATALQTVSSLYATAPIDATGPDYLNAVVVVHTGLQPLQLLHALQALELQAGRERPYRNAPRTLDLDIVLWQGLVLQSAELSLPHPRMDERAFVLAPLAEIAPHSVTAAQLQAVAGQSISKQDCRDWWQPVGEPLAH